MGGVVVPSCNALIGSYNVCFTEEVVSDKEELGVDDIEEDEERRGWRSISCRKLCTRRREWKVIHVIIMVIYRTNSGSKTGTKKSKL